MIVLYNIVNILFVKAVGAKKLRHHMDAVAPLHELRLRNSAAIDALCIGQSMIAINGAHLSSEIREDKELRIFRANLFASPIRKGNLARALVNREEKLAFKLVRTLLADIREHLHLAILVKLAEIGILKKVPKLLVLGHRVVNLINLLLRRLKIARLKSLLGSLNKIVALRSLNADNGIHKRTNLLIDVARGNRCRARDNQRRTSLVNEDRVYFVHNREIVAVLNNLLRALSHAVIAQIVETELGVCTVGNIAQILRTTLLGAHRVLDAAHSKAKKFIEMAHPCGVAAGKIIIYRDELDVLAGKCIQVQRKRGHESFALARLHFGDCAAMKNDAADKLNIERHHVPSERMAADFAARPHETSAGVLDKRVSLRKDGVKRLSAPHARLKLLRHARIISIGKILSLILRLNAVDLMNNRPKPLKLTIVFCTKKLS